MTNRLVASWVLVTLFIVPASFLIVFAATSFHITEQWQRLIFYVPFWLFNGFVGDRIRQAYLGHHQ